MKCLRCGYPLKNKESEKQGLGGFCRHRNSKFKSRWQNKIKRTCDYRDNKPISLDGNKTYWEKMSDGDWVNDKSGSRIKNNDFEKLLVENRLILLKDDVDEELLSRIKDDLDGFFNNGIDKNENV